MDDQHRFEKLAQILFPGSQLVQNWPLSGGISAGMTALEVRLPGGQVRRVVVRRPGAGALRRNPRAAENEFHLLRRLHSLGLAVTEPLYLDAAGIVFPAPYLVIEYIEGRPDFSLANPETFVTQLAAHLVNIHRVDLPRQDASGLPPPAGDLPGLPAAAHPAFETERVHAALKAAWPVRQGNASALLHGDYWPGNILWRDGRLAAVIDWEDAAFGDPLVDFAIARLDLLWIFGWAAMEEFSQQYRSMHAVDISELPYWDLYAALRLARLAGTDLAEWAAFFQPYGRADITEESIRVHYRFFIEQAFKKIG